jgi:hypothetical protein
MSATQPQRREIWATARGSVGGNKCYTHLIQDEVGPDIFLSREALQAAGIDAIQAMDRVRCIVLHRPRGLFAWRVLEVERANNKRLT